MANVTCSGTWAALRIRGIIIDQQRSRSRAEGWTKANGRIAQVGSLDAVAANNDDGEPDTIASLLEAPDAGNPIDDADIIEAVANMLEQASPTPRPKPSSRLR